MESQESNNFPCDSFFSDQRHTFCIKNYQPQDLYCIKEQNKVFQRLPANTTLLQQETIIKYFCSQMEYKIINKDDDLLNTNVENKSQTKVIIQNIQPSKQKLKSRMLAMKGDRLETQNTGKHMKTLINYILKILMSSRSLDKSQVVSVIIFRKSNGAINDFNQLFQKQNLREKCREFIQSHISIEIIMKSMNLSMTCKLLMIKYLQRLRKFTFGKMTNWKQKI